MLHRLELTEAISKLPEMSFEGHVFRITGENFDPTAPSANGGRWAFPCNAEGGCSVLYTSTSRDGAIAEVVSYLALLSPRPSRPLYVHTLEVSARKTVRLTMADLEKLGISRGHFGSRNYAGTQEIGAAINFLGFDGLLAPSARWDCENLILFTENHGLHHKLQKVSVEQIDWQRWAKEQGLLS